jgi:hypothetical protein
MVAPGNFSRDLYATRNAVISPRAMTVKMLAELRLCERLHTA